MSKGRSESFQPADEPIYQDPAEDEASLYEQYQKINVKYIQKDQIRCVWKVMHVYSDCYWAYYTSHNAWLHCKLHRLLNYPHV